MQPPDVVETRYVGPHICFRCRGKSGVLNQGDYNCGWVEGQRLEMACNNPACGVRHAKTTLGLFRNLQPVSPRWWRSCRSGVQRILSKCVGEGHEDHVHSTARHIKRKPLHRGSRPGVRADKKGSFTPGGQLVRTPTCLPKSSVAQCRLG